MKKGIVSLGDHCGEAVPHFCISGSRDVFVKGKPVCRERDGFTEGKILTQGSRTVFANGYGIGRTGDAVSCGFKIVKGSENVFVG